MNNNEIIEITDKVFVPFDWRDPIPGGSNLGRAEFSICLKYKYGKLREYWVDPIQTRINKIWHESSSDIFFSINSYDGLEKTGAWLIGYCETHKCPNIKVYAPNNAKIFELNWHGISFWGNYYEWMKDKLG